MIRLPTRKKKRVCTIPMLLRALKQKTKQNYYLACGFYVFNNLMLALKRWLGVITTISGTTHQALSLQESLDYIRIVFNDYKKMAGVKKFHGTVAEIGPGDNVGVALCFLADGCTRVDLADRFYSKRSSAKQAAIYKALASLLPGVAKIVKGCNLEKDSSFPGLQRYYGPKAAAEQFFSEPAVYDFIVSRSVFEHLDDPLEALKSMVKALKPGGMLIHKVDLKDHGMLSSYFHELKFLEIPDVLYRLMTWRSGYPNRVLINQYRECVKALKEEHTFFITQVAGGGLVVPHVPFEKIPSNILKKALHYLAVHKPKFSKSLRQLKDQDLIVSGFFLILKKK